MQNQSIQSMLSREMSGPLPRLKALDVSRSLYVNTEDLSPNERRRSWTKFLNAQSCIEEQSKFTVETRETITTVAVSRDQEIVAFGGIDKTVALHAMPSGMLILDIKMPAAITGLELSDDSRFLAISTYVCPPKKDKGVALWVNLDDVISWAHDLELLDVGTQEGLHLEFDQENVMCPSFVPNYLSCFPFRRRPHRLCPDLFYRMR